MFEVLVWLYQTYNRFDACPEPPELMQTLSAAGFRESEISEALGWLYALAKTIEEFEESDVYMEAFPSSMRIYVEAEWLALGPEAIGFIQYLEQAKMIEPIQREIIIESAMMAEELPLSFKKFKILVLMVLWSEGRNPKFPESDMIFSIMKNYSICLINGAKNSSIKIWE
ncbi:MAG: DUF494 domain-containing protein [Betaproteobacteria bacterium]|nr:DUF494 domain-containing protein [Betaproteobacteria bacterium]